MVRWLWLVLLFLSWAVQAEDCQVIRVFDGDTLSVRCPGKKTGERIRLLDVDAPERGQAFANLSRNALAGICKKGNPVEIIRFGKDKYGRTLARIFCDGIDAQNYLVGNGWAWTLRHSSNQHLFELQEQARKNRRGLWIANKPMPPWRFRHQK